MAIGASPKTFLSTGRRDPLAAVIHATAPFTSPPRFFNGIWPCVAASILLRMVAQWWGPHLADLLAWTGC
jgi:hypothetical protein